MTQSNSQLSPLIETIFEALEPPTKQMLSFTMNEGGVKVFIVEALLRKGYTLSEGGAPGPKSIWFDGFLKQQLLQLPERTISITPDVRVLSPIKCTIELQCRSVIGSAATLFSKNIIDDVWRVDSGNADLFIMVVDGEIFQRMQGVRDRRGRKPLDENFLPNMISRSDVRVVGTNHKTTRFVIFYTRGGETAMISNTTTSQP